jgi:thiamine-monophosphate kinase
VCSDICAIGELYLLLNIAINRNATKRFLDMFFAGVKDAINVYDTGLIGGDLSSSNKGMSISATVIGYADKYIRRSGAKMGDKIYVTGSLGDSACGLELLKKIKKPVPLRRHLSPSIEKGKGGGVKTLCFEYGLSKKTIEPLLRRHLLPEARNPGTLSMPTSMIDISDGLLIDMSRLCSESKAGARIYEKDTDVLK